MEYVQNTHTHTLSEVFHLALARSCSDEGIAAERFQHTPLPPDHRKRAKTRDANQLTSITSTVSPEHQRPVYLRLFTLPRKMTHHPHNEMMKDREAFCSAEEHQGFPEDQLCDICTDMCRILNKLHLVQIGRAHV